MAGLAIVCSSAGLRLRTGDSGGQLADLGLQGSDGALSVRDRGL